MKRIIVIGSPGAGKSTFARQLRDITGLTRSFEPSCHKMCSDEEYELLKTAFFEKEKNMNTKRMKKMLETERLILRRWNENDAGDLYKLILRSLNYR